jgi:hypothetical protein
VLCISPCDGLSARVGDSLTPTIAAPCGFADRNLQALVGPIPQANQRLSRLTQR